MLNLSPEIAALRPPDAERLLARERREIFSIHPELRAISWGGAILIAAGVAMLLAKNYERIGPLAIAAGVAAVSFLLYGYAFWRRSSAPSVVGEYILLLAALLLSADLAFIEGQFQLLDHGWPRHLLLLAIVHAVTAYLFDSRTLLSLSIASLAAWMGVEQRVETLFESSNETAARSFACAATVLFWTGIDRRVRPLRTFDRVFEHFAANLALAGALILVIENDGTRAVWTLLVAAIAAAVAWHGFRVRAESFVLYAYAYAFFAVVLLVVELLNDDVAVMLFVLVASIAAIAGLFFVHFQYRKRTAVAVA